MLRARIGRFTVLVLLLLMLSASGGPARAASAGEINAGVAATLDQFFRFVGSARELASRSAAMLVFPTVVKAGFGIGGEYGEGALLIGGRTVAYYNTIAASVGFQL